MTTLTSREFNQNSGRAKRAAQNGPVFITDRGKPAHVLLTIEDYRKLNASSRTLAQILACPESSGIAFEPISMQNGMFKVEDFS